jgi:hypothetical protein
MREFQFFESIIEKQNFLTLAITEPAAQKAEYCIVRAANLIISYLTQNTFARKNLLK